MTSSLDPGWPLWLASTSKYRRELLERLRWPFECMAPEVDETPRPGQSPAALSERLARAKADDVAGRWIGLHGSAPAVVIGSDQVAELDGQPVGKPGDHAGAVIQLQSLSGRDVVFHTAVCVRRVDTGQALVARVPVKVRFRVLTEGDIETYLRLDEPYDCAGSAKCETLGIALLDAVVSDDPTALIGLPLIATTRLLREVGLDVLRRPA